MEEIEYRVWSEIAHGFSYATIKEGAGPIYVHGTPEQYTGLRDKNGVKIYVGDIVSSHNGDVLSRIVRSPNGEYRMHHIGIFGGECSLFPEQDFVEVIGNIHENPELLEGEK